VSLRRGGRERSRHCDGYECLTVRGEECRRGRYEDLGRGRQRGPLEEGDSGTSLNVNARRADNENVLNNTTHSGFMSLHDTDIHLSCPDLDPIHFGTILEFESFESENTVQSQSQRSHESLATRTYHRDSDSEGQNNPTP
jgi:hypothetical protein